MRKSKRALPPVCSQRWIDVVDLAMHRAIVRKIRRQPKLFDRAKRTLARWERVKGGCPPALREWKTILNRYDRETVFCGILKKDEAQAIWARHDKT